MEAESARQIPLQMLPSFEELDFIPTPFHTWWTVSESHIENLLNEATQRVERARIEAMKDRLRIHPVNVYEEGAENPTPAILAARYEMTRYGQPLTKSEVYKDADKLGISWNDVYGFVDFIIGVPFASIDIIKVIGERTTKQEDLEVIANDGTIVPPMPKELFKDKEMHKVVFDTLWLERNADCMADNLLNEYDLVTSQFWLRFFLTRTIKYEVEGKINEEVVKFPIPGELLGLAVRMMPYLPYMEQGSSPFLYTGNYIETIFYTCALVEDVIEVDPDNIDKVPYEKYKIFYRGKSYIISPTDFRSYFTDEEIKSIKNKELFVFVNILKDYNEFFKQSMLWKDEKLPTDKWRVFPVEFYLKDEEQ